MSVVLEPLTPPTHSSPETISDRLMNLVRRMWPREGLLTLMLLMFMMLSTVWSVESAGWVDQLPSLPLLCIIGTFLGFLFAKMHMPWFVTWPVAALYGAFFVIGQASSIIAKATLDERIVDLIIRINAWGYAARTGSINTDPVVFVFWLCTLTYILSFVSAWLVFRSHRIWWGILPSGVAILMNLRYAPPQATIWFFFYLVFALLLIIRFNLFKQHETWKNDRLAVGSSIGFASLPEMTVYSFAIAGVIWFAPGAGFAPVVSDIWNTITAPYTDISIEFNRLFANLNTTNEGPATTFSRSLVLKGPIKLGTSIIMFVQTDQPVYLRATTYDVYNGKGFVTGDKDTVSFPPGSELPTPTKVYKSVQELTQKITLRATPGNAILAAGVPLRSTQRSVAEIDRPVSHFMNLDDSSTDASLPADLRSLAPRLRETFTRLRSEGKLGTSPADMPSDAMTGFPTDLKVATYLSRDGRIGGIELRRLSPYAPDFTSVRVPGRGRAPTQYNVVSYISNASETELRRSGSDYPGFVTDRYLQLPPSVSERVRRLARQLTEGTDNNYDKAIRIQEYLRTFRYNEQIEPPPPNGDPLEHFLFTSKEGYCDYFSSSMVVMLRSLGIPARIAAGYYTGEFDSNRGYYLVRESNTHAWPEVYFPEYGWIEFEPTPSRPLITRGTGTTDDNPAISGPSTSIDEIPLEDPGFLDEELLMGATGTLESEQRVPVLPFLLLGLIAVSAGTATFVWRRGLRGLSLVPRTYEKVRRLAALAFRPQRPSETPMEYGQSLSQKLPDSETAINRVMRGYTASRYSSQPLTTTELVRMERAWVELRTALLKLAAKRPLSFFKRR